MTARDSYADVGAATRRAIGAAFSAQLSEGALKVLLALIWEVPTWSRLSDTVTRTRLSELTGLSERQVSRHIQTLVKHDVVMWMPGSKQGAKRTSRVVFQRATCDTQDVSGGGDDLRHTGRPRSSDDLGHLERPRSGARPETSDDTTWDTSASDLGHIEARPETSRVSRIRESEKSESSEEQIDVIGLRPGDDDVVDELVRHLGGERHRRGVAVLLSKAKLVLDEAWVAEKVHRAMERNGRSLQYFETTLRQGAKEAGVDFDAQPSARRYPLVAARPSPAGDEHGADAVEMPTDVRRRLEELRRSFGVAK